MIILHFFKHFFSIFSFLLFVFFIFTYWGKKLLLKTENIIVQEISADFKWFLSNSLNTHITYITHITHITYLHNSYNLHNSDNLHNSCYVHNSYNLTNITWQITMIKNTRKDSGKKHAKNIKIFLKKKNTNGEKSPWERYQNLTEEEKEKKDIIRIFLRNESKSYLSIEEIIIENIINNYWATF